MKCMTPREVFSKGSVSVDPYFVNSTFVKLVPCGNCYACQTNRRNEWDLRLRFESMRFEYNYFLTLTYEESFLPSSMDDWKQDVLDFIKRLRRNFSIHYYAIGEYGENFGRMHNHILLFSNDEITLNYFYDYWTKGFIDIGRVEDASIHYVTKWHINPKFQEGKEEHGFCLMSKGIGSNFLDSLTKDNLHSTHSMNGKRLPVSRYYRKKLDFKCYHSMGINEYISKRYNLNTDEQITKKHQELIESFKQKQNNPRKSLF